MFEFATLCSAGTKHFVILLFKERKNVSIFIVQYEIFKHANAKNKC